MHRYRTGCPGRNEYRAAFPPSTDGRQDGVQYKLSMNRRPRSPTDDLAQELIRNDGQIRPGYTPAWLRGSAFVDPTHVNVITTPFFSMYFCKPDDWASRYGFVGLFVLRQQDWRGENLVSILQKN